MLEVNDKLFSAREKMLKHERLKKMVWAKSKNYPILFGFSTEKAYICIAFRVKSSLTITLHHFDSYSITLRHKHCTTCTNNLHRFHCISKPPPSLLEWRSVKKSLTPNPEPHPLTPLWRARGTLKARGEEWKVKRFHPDGIFTFHSSLFTYLVACVSKWSLKLKRKFFYNSKW